MTRPFSFVKNLFSVQQQRSATLVELNAKNNYRSIEEPEALNIHQAKAQFYQAMLNLNATSSLAFSLNSLSLPQKLILDVARNSLSEKNHRQKAVPRLPTIIPRLLKSLRDPEASSRHFVDIINKDPALSAAVLKLANSAYFNPTTVPIENLETAVVKLGVDGLRAVLSAAVMQPLVQKKTEYFSQFGVRLWEHSLAVAVTCELLAPTRKLIPYKAYLLGLCHDIGKITLFSELIKQFRQHSSDHIPPPETFLPLLNERSDSLSAAIALDWELPKDICTALQQQVDIEHGQQVGPYAHLLFQANLICEAYSVSKHCVEHRIDLKKLARQLEIPETILTQLDCLAIQI